MSSLCMLGECVVRAFETEVLFQHDNVFFRSVSSTFLRAHRAFCLFVNANCLSNGDRYFQRLCSGLQAALLISLVWVCKGKLEMLQKVRTVCKHDLMVKSWLYICYHYCCSCCCYCYSDIYSFGGVFCVLLVCVCVCVCVCLRASTL